MCQVRILFIGLFLFFIIHLRAQSLRPFDFNSTKCFSQTLKSEEKRYASAVNSCCHNKKFYEPDSSSEIRILRVRLNIVYDEDTLVNVPFDKSEKFFRKLIKHTNDRLANNKPMNLPAGNSTPVLPINYRYQVVPADDIVGDRGVSYIFDDSLYFYLHKGKNSNHYNRDIIKKYGIGLDSTVNLFFMSFPVDSLAKESFSAPGTGIALGTAVKVSANYSEILHKPWALAGLINHEIGHILSLSHTWPGHDGCKDTPKNNNCWNIKKGDSRCGEGKVSNNMMDYNAHQDALTPCQLSQINRHFLQKDSKQRKLLLRNWCNPANRKDYRVRGTEHWQGSRDLYGDLIVEKNAILKIDCELRLPKGGKIILEPGSQLILDQAKLYNTCHLKWEGIFVHRRICQKRAKVQFIGRVEINDTQMVCAPTQSGNEN